MKQALVIIYRSDNGQDGWEPVLDKDVPEWVKNPKVMGNLIRGVIAQQESRIALPTSVVNPWYRAERVMSDEDKRRTDDAKAKRERREAARRATPNRRERARVTH